MAQLQVSYRKRSRILPHVSRWVLNGFLVLLGLLMLAPFFWILVNSFIVPNSAVSLPPKWLPVPFTLDNYRQVFALIPFGLLALNSLEITLIVTIGGVVTSALAAYALARLNFPGRTLIFVLFLSALMVPTQVTAIPTFILMRLFGLLDTHEAVYLPALINVLGIFLLRQFFLTIPRELEDAARLDGAGYFRTLMQIILPLARPALASLAIYIFQATWNDFFWPNLFLSTPAKMTLPVGLVSLQSPYGGGASPTVIFAAISMVLVPILIVFIFAQRSITQSIASTGLKG
ncbi:MAG TPA: carbohydrate ABC transporter permease [Ktedonobacteraceae bacterium]|jgi:multiple sugar transport system permease protein|nr:carbohydrate ABC transporter permease [Ktedonobacteraceae bacterium]